MFTGRMVVAFFENILQTLSKEWFFGFVSTGEVCVCSVYVVYMFAWIGALFF